VHVPRFFIALAVLGIGCGGSTDSSSGTDAGAGAGGAGAIGGTGGSSGSCIQNSDCPADGVCGFAISDACNATGQCFPAPTAICNAYSPGCACDGTTISIVCTGFPDGYAEKPVAYAGDCAVDAGVPFPCGASLTCDSATQYCKVAEGGPCCNPPSYSCESIPPACTQDASCGCIQAAVSGQDCSESGGGVTVTFLYP
jgi:hypothetical protein